MNTNTHEQKEGLEGKIRHIPNNLSGYIEYIQKGLRKIIDFEPFESIDNNRAVFDILYLIGLGSELGVIGKNENNIDMQIYNNIKQGFIKEGYRSEDAEKCTNIISKYISNLDIVDQLLNEKSVLLLGQKGYLKNMNAINDGFFDSKEALLEKGINSEQKGKEGCYIVAYQYSKELSDRLSNISHEISKFIKEKREQGFIDDNVDFIEYTSDNIHTSLLTTQTSHEFFANEKDISRINESLENSGIYPFKLNIKGIKVNSNSLIVATIPENAVFLENIKKSLGSLPKELNFGGARGSHITIGRFIGEIKNKKVLEELYEMIDWCSKDLPSEISPEKIVVGYINMETKYNEGSYFKIFPKHSVRFEED